MLTHTLNLVQKYGITVHAKMPYNIAKLGLGFAERNLTLTTVNSTNNTPEIDACIKFRISGLMVLLSSSVTRSCIKALP